jgi:hypothetical protein
VIYRGRWLTILTQSNTGMVDAGLHMFGDRLTVRYLRRVPVDQPQISYVRKTQYRLRFVVHPGVVTFERPSHITEQSWNNMGRALQSSLGVRTGRGCGDAMRIVCEECGADYPFNWQMPKLTPCANCAVPRESGWRMRVGLAERWKWERVRSV